MSGLTVDLASTGLTIEFNPHPSLIVDQGGGFTVDLAERKLTADFGSAGLPGLNGTGGRFSAVAAATLPAGTPVTISRATGQVGTSVASWKPSAFVAGLLETASGTDFPVNVATALLTLADWTGITGAASLLPGVPYFLGVGGGLTATPPSSPNCLTLVGKALNATTMIIDPQAPIQL